MVRFGTGVGIEGSLDITGLLADWSQGDEDDLDRRWEGVNWNQQSRDVEQSLKSTTVTEN